MSVDENNDESGKLNAVPSTVPDASPPAPLHEDIVLRTGEAAQATALALDPSFEANELAKEAMSRLHPAFYEALAHPIAKLDIFRTRNIRRDVYPALKQILFSHIDSLNGMIDDFIQRIEDPKAHISSRDGKELMDFLRSNATYFGMAGIFNTVYTALQVIAMTKVREAAKVASSDPFDPEQFKREQTLHEIMNDLLDPL